MRWSGCSALAGARLEGAPLGLATWRLAWLVAEALLAFPGLAGGEQGLAREAPAVLRSSRLGLSLTTPAVHVAGAGSLAVLTLLALWRLAAGPGGLDLAVLREDPALAASRGIPVAVRRRAVLTGTAALGGLWGAGTVVLPGLVAPADVSPLLSLQLFAAVLLGGTARWWGPVAGVEVERPRRRAAGARRPAQRRAGAQRLGSRQRGRRGGARRPQRRLGRACLQRPDRRGPLVRQRWPTGRSGSTA